MLRLYLKGTAKLRCRLANIYMIGRIYIMILQNYKIKIILNFTNGASVTPTPGAGCPRAVTWISDYSLAYHTKYRDREVLLKTTNLLKITHNRQPIARPWGRGMGCRMWVHLTYMYYVCRCPVLNATSYWTCFVRYTAVANLCGLRINIQTLLRECGWKSWILLAFLNTKRQWVQIRVASARSSDAYMRQ